MSEAYVPTRYVSIEKQGNYVGPPPYSHRAPPYRSRRSSGGCGFLRCCCCCCFSCCRGFSCCLLIIIVLLIAIIASFYFLLKPHIPTYNIDNLDVTTFDIKKDNKLYSEFAVVVKAENPNEEIGLDYGQNSISIIYSGSQLCSGQFPPFLQPLLIIVKVPIKLVFRELIHFRKLEVNVNCSLVVDHLLPNQKPKILKKEFTYGVHF